MSNAKDPSYGATLDEGQKDLEADILAALLASNADMKLFGDLRAAGLAEDWFGEPVHAAIFRAMSAANAADAPTVATALEAAGDRATIPTLRALVLRSSSSDRARAAQERLCVLRIRRRANLLGVSAAVACELNAESLARLAKDLSDLTPKAARTAPADITARDLLSREYPPLQFLVEGILPVGLGILVGPPKVGKSFLALNLSLAVANGGFALGGLRTTRGGVLYLALEDSERRLQDRVRTFLQGESAPDNLYFRTACPRADQGGLDRIERMLDAHPDMKLVVIDVLAKFRSATGKRTRGTSYESDYEEMGGLQDVARQRGVAILLVTHKRKMEATDPLDSVNGSTGIAGSADVVWILSRARTKADAILIVSGRDVVEREYALKFESSSASWAMLGNADEYRANETEVAIFRTLDAVKGPIRVQDVLDHGDLRGDRSKLKDRIKQALRRSVEKGELAAKDRGRYVRSAIDDLAPVVPFVPLSHPKRNTVNPPAKTVCPKRDTKGTSFARAVPSSAHDAGRGDKGDGSDSGDQWDGSDGFHDVKEDDDQRRVDDAPEDESGARFEHEEEDP